MNIEQYRTYCLSKIGVTEHFPFDDVTLVFKVGGKMFALADVEEFLSVNLKCDPERAMELRETFTAVQPGYHMSKKHWNTIEINGDLADNILLELIDHSYELVFNSLTKKVRNELQAG